MRRAAGEELLRMREEAEEKDRQRGNRMRDNRRRQRRRRRRLGKENETVDIADKGRKEGEQVDPVRRGPAANEATVGEDDQRWES